MGSRFLTVLISHLPADRVRDQLSYLEALAPGARFVLCYGGPRDEFKCLGSEGALFIEDPALRGASTKRQSYNAILAGVYRAFVESDETVELIYFIEYDQLILRGDYEQMLTELIGQTGADLLAKSASPRNDTNWPHHLASRDDQALDAFFRGISGRDDPGTRFGCLGSGMLLRRKALSAFCSVLDDAPHAYLELFIPTVVHHLGFEVVDVDGVSDAYQAMRWQPSYAPEEVAGARRAGLSFLHPFKGSIRDLALD